MHFKNKFLI